MIMDSVCKNENIKLVLIGDSNVGKTSIIFRLCKNRFNVNNSSTVGASFWICNKKYSSNNNTVAFKFMIWDTAGQERYKSVLPLYTRNANVVLIVYDNSDIASLHAINNYWTKYIKDHIYDMKNPIFYLIGNKNDIHTNVQLNHDNLIEKIKSQFTDYIICQFTTSAKTGDGIPEVFDHICKTIVESDINFYETNIADLQNEMRTSCC